MALKDLAAAKTALRMLVRNRRRELARQHPEADWKLVDVARGPLTARFPDPRGKVAAVYHGLGSELSALALADWLAEAGWTLALPSVEGADPDDPDGPAGRMVFRRWRPGETLVRDAIGLIAPAPENPIVEPDLVVAPLLGFDRQGRRLGQGGGYYDRALEALRARKRVFVLGLAYVGQETHGLPDEPHDQRLDAILTESEYIAVQED
ncbi:5-formyltetrahydrofolate cyclo-ligase [Caulobacter sp. UNC279MFTsu5.1]|uniref:5-formyltetrahydrofolate cyclo-ligase n=1 Tax=Caulobacter sp. UNC279MFTsu5.1 TaxID=1502775 RepID=UPI0008E9BD06|nr:5-formyltetrahydrofolate cyclo-ligase [Caulobacter sp. UNC279MFTsu5.1]SFJ18138.1 5-formyltetrahydrofolate cyclo-ligase [Caulobacter sp. UNC279MFTsu5.1]